MQNTINHLRIGVDQSRLYDAMSRGISLLEERPAVRRRILVVISEAQDSGSESKLGEVLRQAQLANVTIYTIGLSTSMADLRAKPNPYQGPQLGAPGTFPVPVPPGMAQTPDNEAAAQGQGNIDLLALAVWLVKTGKNAIGPNSLEIASKATGGLHVSTMKDRSIQKAMDAIGGELHAQYTMGYRPPGDEPTGYHEIKVTVDRPGRRRPHTPGLLHRPAVVRDESFLYFFSGSGAAASSSSRIEAAAAMRSPSSSRSKRTPCVERPASRISPE